MSRYSHLYQHATHPTQEYRPHPVQAVHPRLPHLLVCRCLRHQRENQHRYLLKASRRRPRQVGCHRPPRHSEYPHLPHHIANHFRHPHQVNRDLTHHKGYRCLIRHLLCRRHRNPRWYRHPHPRECCGLHHYRQVDREMLMHRYPQSSLSLLYQV